METKAKEYAEGKFSEMVNKLIEDAYKAGYETGYNLGREEQVQNGKSSNNIVEDGVEYVDLGLPSGTLWATDFIRDTDGKIIYLNYEDKKDKIPTIEQWRELDEKCASRRIGNKVQILGPNGKSIFLENTGYIEYEEIKCSEEVRFWIKNMPINDKRSLNCVEIRSNNYRTTNYVFPGYNVPVLLVK